MATKKIMAFLMAETCDIKLYYRYALMNINLIEDRIYNITSIFIGLLKAHTFETHKRYKREGSRNSKLNF